MNIHILKDYYLKSDAHNIIVSKKVIAKSGKNTGEESYTSLTYHATIPEALEALKQRVIRESGAESMSDVAKAISDLKQAYNDAKLTIR